MKNYNFVFYVNKFALVLIIFQDMKMYVLANIE